MSKNLSTDFLAAEAFAVEWLQQRYRNGQLVCRYQEMKDHLQGNGYEATLTYQIMRDLGNRQIVKRLVNMFGSRAGLVRLRNQRSGANGLQPEDLPAIGCESLPSLMELRLQPEMSDASKAKPGPKNQPRETAHQGMLRLLKELGDVVLEWDSPVIAKKLNVDDSTIRHTTLWKKTWPEERRQRRIQVVTKAKRSDRRTEPSRVKN